MTALTRCDCCQDLISPATCLATITPPDLRRMDTDPRERHLCLDCYAALTRWMTRYDRTTDAVGPDPLMLELLTAITSSYECNVEDTDFDEDGPARCLTHMSPMPCWHGRARRYLAGLEHEASRAR